MPSMAASGAQWGSRQQLWAILGVFSAARTVSVKLPAVLQTGVFATAAALSDALDHGYLDREGRENKSQGKEGTRNWTSFTEQRVQKELLNAFIVLGWNPLCSKLLILA